MAQYKVPQNIDMQDRIVGPLTLYQFLYLLCGGLIFYATLKTPGIIDLILIGAPVGLFTLALCFIKINDQPFSRFIVSFIFYLTHPKSRIWHHGDSATQIAVSHQQSGAQKHVERHGLNLELLQSIAEKADKA